jgi:K+-sensing histidine kinase KdpD
MEMEWYRQHHGVVRVLAVVVPLLAAAGLHAATVLIPSNAATLILVLLVVGAASTGDRLSGVLAAVSSALGFDFFLTQPYLQLRIDNVEDVELAVLLLVVGVAVSELASWGVRQGATAIEQAGFVHGALESADLAAGSTNVDDALERVSDSLRTLLGASEVTFEYGDHDASAAIVERNGTVRYQGKTLDLTRTGLPAAPHAFTAIPVVQRGAQVGYFRISTPSRDLRPSRDQLRVAVLLAGEFSLRAEPIRGSVRRAAKTGTP